MRAIWDLCVQASSDAFEIDRTKAKLFLVALFTCMGLMILETWFIWAGLIAAVVAVLGVFLIVEHSLRAWYAVRDCSRPHAPTAAASSQGPSVPDRPPVPCADAQGRIEKNDLPGQDVNAMAEQILRTACVRKVVRLRHSWPRFPAISRAMPRLAAAGRVVFGMLAR